MDYDANDLAVTNWETLAQELAMEKFCWGSQKFCIITAD